MVEIRPPADGATPPPSSILGSSIEIGVAETPSFDDFAMPTLDVANRPVVATAAIPVPVSVSSRSKWLWWGIGGASVLVAGGLAAFALLGNRESPSSAAKLVAHARVEHPAFSEPVPKMAEQPPDAAADAKANEAPIAASDPPPAEAVAAAELEPPAAEPPLTSATPSSGNEPVAEPAANQPTASAAAATNVPPASGAAGGTPRPRPVMSLDPLDFDPSQFSFSAGNAPNAPPGTGSIPQNGELETKADEENASAEATGAGKALAPPPQVDRSLTVRLGPLPNGNVSPQRTAEQLGTRLESISVEDTQLCRFVDMVSTLADVAVTLDPLELALAGVAPRQQVAIDAKEATVEKILRDVLAKQRLDLVERDGQLSVMLADGEKHKEVTYDVADLAGSDDATPLAGLLRQFVAPDSWTAARGGGTIEVEKSKLRIEQSQRVRHEALIFCERLRLARGLSQRSRYPASLLATQSPYEVASSTLKRRTTFTFLPWTRFSDVLRHWQDASTLTILVDWRALAEIELGPSSPVTCSANNRTWEEALDGILERIGLAWWAVNGETIQITTQEALDNIRRVEFYEVPKTLQDRNASSSAVIESLQKELAAVDSASPPVMEIDEKSNRLIVLASPRIHRALSKRLSPPAN
jgi:hypothetical protein